MDFMGLWCYGGVDVTKHPISCNQGAGFGRIKNMGEAQSTCLPFPKICLKKFASMIIMRSGILICPFFSGYLPGPCRLVKAQTVILLVDCSGYFTLEKVIIDLL